MVAACAPVGYPRLADVAKQGRFRAGLATNAGYSSGRVRVLHRSQVGTATAPKRMQGNVAALNVSTGEGEGVLGTPFWTEAQAAGGLFEPCEIGAAISMLRFGIELRCAVTRPEASHGIGVALGTAGFHHTLFGSDVGASSFQWRSTLEISGKGNTLTPLLNVALMYGRTQRHFDNREPLYKNESESEGWYFGSSGIFAVRDEWKIGLPVGISLPINPPKNVSVIIGLVPEWTLDASNLRTACVHCSETAVLGFEQSFSLFFTLGLHVADE